MSLDRKYDAVVVGGGHNGLVAATYLARAGKSVILLEAEGELGGATTSVRSFPDFDARLSRYSYLVSLLPDKIVSDLGINFKTLERSIASYTPYRTADLHQGLLISQNWDERTAQGFRDLTGTETEAINWQNFYSEIAQLAQRIAPTLLQPLKSVDTLRDEIGLPQTWKFLIERPIGESIRERFSNDIVRGIILTDALIGTYTSADDLQANRCFLYHLIGNGTGQWRVPLGGMGALVAELKRVALNSGVEIKLNSRISGIDSDKSGVVVTGVNGVKYVGRDLLFAAAPQTLAKIRGSVAPNSLDGSQLKINMLVSRLPRLKSGIDPRLAFAGTLHINESYKQLERAYQVAGSGSMPDDLPLEIYCHTLSDSSILSPELAAQGYQTLTLFGLHTPASLFDSSSGSSSGSSSDSSRDTARAAASQAALASLNQYLLDPIESVLAICTDGSLAMEVKSPLDLESDIGLPRGNIFHRDLDFPFIDGSANANLNWGAETDDPHIFLAGAGARRGGGVSGIAGHNAAMAVLASD
jgi:phytoene dehydrogenase-like protein